jgi:hypothetical protein
VTFFFYRNFGRKVPEALRLLGLDVVWHDEQGLAPHTTDEEWLAIAGSAGWIVVTHDIHISSNLAERQALADAGVGCFVLAGGKVAKWEKVRTLASAWPQLLSKLTPPRPYIWRYHQQSGWRRLYP